MPANSAVRPRSRVGGGVIRVGGCDARSIAALAGRPVGRDGAPRALGFEIRFFEIGPMGRPGVRAPGNEGGRASTG
jgi:hypothetical protein